MGPCRGHIKFSADLNRQQYLIQRQTETKMTKIKGVEEKRAVKLEEGSFSLRIYTYAG